MVRRWLDERTGTDNVDGWVKWHVDGRCVAIVLN